jgi:DNA-binding NtrC family response regulator
VCVVDPRANALVGGVKAGHDIQIETVRSHRDALRLAQQQPMDLWVIVTDPDEASGCDLCTMLASRQPQAAICVVAERYSADLERRAYASGAAAFGVAPAHFEWVDAWVAHRTSQHNARRKMHFAE